MVRLEMLFVEEKVLNGPPHIQEQAEAPEQQDASKSDSSGSRDAER